MLPIVPFYLSYMAGSGAETLARGEPLHPAVRNRAVIGAVLFALGIVAVFIGLGAAATAFGQLVRDWFDLLLWLAVGVIVVMGMHFLGVFRNGLLYRSFGSGIGSTRNVSFPGAYVPGLAIAFGWTPCVGPVLAAILILAGS